MFNIDSYRVYFKHFPQEEGIVGYPYSREVNSTLEYRGKTQCFITENDNEIALGESYCSVNDNFSRKVGRYISFTRAVWTIESKEVRTKLWNEYRLLGGIV